MSDNVNRLLIVDDEPGVVDFITAAAHQLDYTVASAGTAAEFLTLVDSFRPSLIVMDLHLPDGDGVELLRMLVARGFKAPVLIMSGVDERVLAAAHELGTSQGLKMYGTLAKPVLLGDLRMKLAAAAQTKQSRTLDADDLKRGIAAGEIVPYYQPKASLTERGWTIDGVEAPARWQHPQLGVVMPDEFVPLAERTGAIGDLTRWVLDSALAQARAWRDAGLDMTMAVNLAAPNIADATLPDAVAALLERHGVPGDRLECEISEHTVMADPRRALLILDRLRGLGVKLSLDDFGTGHSSLSYLKRLPLDEVKIDRSFVMGMTEDDNDAAIVRTTIDLARNLGLEVVAEGVETETILRNLSDLSCDVAQGFYLSRPLPAAELDGWLAQRAGITP